MNCPSCGNENPPDSSFCFECGGSLAIRCSHCEAELPAAVKFCNRCGQPTASASSPAAERAPRSYTPKHLADKILQSKSALEGERKQVTVLFADVKSSTGLAEQLDPEDWHALLDRFFQILTDGVHRFEGTVNQYTGDGIMALFGAPIAHEDHAQRACHAALHLRDELSRYADELLREHRLVFATRMGLNSGEVVVGKIGDDLRMDYTAQGHTVALAQRMEALAEDGTPYLAAATAKLVEGFFELDDQGDFEVKGAHKPVRVFALRGTGSARTRVDSPTRAGLSRFVGRDDELASLMTAFREADAGRGQVVGVVAGPGLGKSRLAREFVNRVRAAGAFVVEIHCPSHGKQVPLITYLDLVRNTFRIGQRDDQATTRAKIKGRFSNAYPEIIELMPLLCDFLGAPDPEQPLPPITPEQRQKRLLEWQQRALRARRQQECVVYVFEDMHWIDPASEKLVDSVVQITPDLRQLVLMTYRPEYTPPWGSSSFYRQVPLLSLTDSAMGDLLEGLLGPELAGSDLARLIRERCGGTPFFLEELVQSLAESDALEGERGAYRLAKPIDQIPLPETVQAVLAARIDRLPEREKQVLQTASVIGRVFPRDVLEAVSNESGVDTALRGLMDAELVYEESVYPDPEYSFKHALVQDVAYASQLKSRREGLHRRVADALERHYADQLDAKAAVVAQHREAGAEPLSAAQWQARAARWVGASDRVAALEHWQRARALLRPLEESPERTRLLPDVYAELLETMERVGVDLAESEESFEEARAFARQVGDRWAEARATAMYAWLLTGKSQWAGALEAAEAALELADALGDARLRLFTRQTLARVHIWFSPMSAVIHATDEILEIGGGEKGVHLTVLGHNPYLITMVLRAIALTWSGRPREGMELHKRLCELVRSPGLAADPSGPFTDAVWSCWICGEGEQALRFGTEAMRQAERHGSEWTKVFSLTGLGIANVIAERWSDAVRTFERAHEVIDTAGVGLEYAPAIRLFEGVAHAYLGDADRALSLSHEGLDEAHQRGSLLLRVMGGLNRARILRLVSGRDGVDELAAQIEETLPLIEQGEFRGMLPMILLERAGLAGLRGDPDAKAQDLAEARRLHREMGISGWNDYARSIEV